MTTMNQATCVYHTGKPAVATCKQCGKTTCRECTVTGPTGNFCSTTCRTANEARTIQARDVEGRARSAFFVRFRGLLGKLIVFAAAIAAAVFITNVFEIPVLSQAVGALRRMLGF